MDCIYQTELHSDAAIFNINVHSRFPCRFSFTHLGLGTMANRSAKTGNAAILSFAGLLFATTSALLAGGAILYSFWIGGFPYYDPRLLKIYFFGIVLSLPAITLSALGAARKNLLRWHALGSSAGIFLFWFMAMLSE